MYAYNYEYIEHNVCFDCYAVRYAVSVFCVEGPIIINRTRCEHVVVRRYATSGGNKCQSIPILVRWHVVVRRYATSGGNKCQSIPILVSWHVCIVS